MGLERIRDLKITVATYHVLHLLSLDRSTSRLLDLLLDFCTRLTLYTDPAVSLVYCLGQRAHAKFLNTERLPRVDIMSSDPQCPQKGVR